MKMPEKHDLLAAILAAKEQGIGAILAFAMAYLRGRYNGGAFTKTVIDATMCAIITGSFVTFSTSPDWQSRLYNERVYQLHQYPMMGLLSACAKMEVKMAKSSST